MDLLVNDLSLHGQFSNLDSFRVSLGQVMKIREIARRNGRAVYCHRNLVNGQVTAQARMPAAVKSMPLDAQRAIMGWLSQQGPFWDDDRQHDGGDWYECCAELVTDTALAEAAHCVLNGIDRGLVSLAPSNFTYDPVEVDRVVDDETRQPVSVRNHWDPATVEAFFVTAPANLTSWTALANLSIARFTTLTISDDAFEPLRGQPFKPSVAEKILKLLNVLHQLRQSFDERGLRTADGHAVYQRHFTGERAWFSDSSDTEKQDFANDLTFRHPHDSEATLFCTWHGKVKSPQYRIHFSWPVTATTPVYIVYVGPKITKR